MSGHFGGSPDYDQIDVPLERDARRLDDPVRPRAYDEEAALSVHIHLHAVRDGVETLEQARATIRKWYGPEWARKVT